MDKKVSASTITEITAARAVSGRDVSKPLPTADGLLAQIQNEIKDEVYRLQNLTPEEKKKQKKLSKVLARALKKEATLKRLLKEKPDGFKLVPTLYTRINENEKKAVQKEYYDSLRPLFFRFIAKNQQAELKALGFCDFSIQRMRRGMEPRTEKGDFYETNIDHIVERSGSGHWAVHKKHDMDLPTGMGETYPVNHMSNFVLLPKKVHEYKNDLNTLQDTASLASGQSKWILMMVPDMPENAPQYVCPPQKNKSLYGMRMGGHSEKEHYASFIIQTVNRKLRIIKQATDVHYILPKFNQKAQIARKTVLDIADDVFDTKNGKSLKQVFEERVLRSDVPVKFAYGDLKEYLPELIETFQSLVKTYANRPEETKNPKADLKAADEIAKFLKLYNSFYTKQMRKDLKNIPFPPARAVLDAFEQMDHKIIYLESRELFFRNRAQKPHANLTPPDPNAPRAPIHPSNENEPKKKRKKKTRRGNGRYKNK